MSALSPGKIVCKQSLVPLLIFSIVFVTLHAGQAAQKGDEARPPFLFPDGIVFDIVFSKDGQSMAIACEDKAVRIYDWRSGQLRNTLRGHNERVWAIAFSPDGKTLASCTGEYRTPDQPGEVTVWDLATSKEVMTFRGHRGLVFGVCYSPDGKALYSGSWDGTVIVWDLTTKQEKGVLQGHKGPIRRVRFTPDGKAVVSAGFDGTVRFWDPATLKQQREIRAHEEGVASVVFTPDSKLMITCSRPNTPRDPAAITVWDAATGQEKATIKGASRYVLALAVSPDGAVLAMGGGFREELGEVKLFELATGKERGNFLGGHKEWVESVVFTPDGQWLVSGGGYTRGAPGEIRMWDLPRLLGKKSDP